MNLCRLRLFRIYSLGKYDNRTVNQAILGGCEERHLKGRKTSKLGLTRLVCTFVELPDSLHYGFSIFMQRVQCPRVGEKLGITSEL